MFNKILSVILVLVMFATVLVGCSKSENPNSDNSSAVSTPEGGTTTTSSHASGDGNQTTGSGESQTTHSSKDQNPVSGTSGSSANVTTTTTTTAGNNPWAPRKSNSPSSGELVSLNPTFTWKDATGAKSYTLKLEEYKNGSYTTIFTKSGLTETQYKYTASLKYDCTYRYTVSYNNGSKDTVMDDFPITFYSMVDVKNHPANKGRDYTVNKKVSETVLKNYLSRSVVMESFIADYAYSSKPKLRLLLQSGAKYVARSAGSWMPSASEEANFSKYQEAIAAAHAIDSDLVFEFCVFECVSKVGVKSIQIPAWVFEAFGKKVENRSFNMDYMKYPSGAHVGDYGAGTCNVDITRPETQMFYYYRACRAIDAGFEGIHWGAMELSAEKDDNYACWTKVVNMVREYAKTHARRGFVFNNAHTCGVMGSDGKLVFDFHCKPTRVQPVAGSTAHKASESNPQKAELSAVPSGIPTAQQHLIIYNKSLGGMTHSGWSCKSLPYFVELDNWGGVHNDYKDTPNYPYYPWGYDEISWFANQPLSYQKQWVAYAYKKVQEIDPQCFFEMPGGRTSWLNSKNAMGYFSADASLFATYREVWTQN